MDGPNNLRSGGGGVGRRQGFCVKDLILNPSMRTTIRRRRRTITPPPWIIHGGCARRARARAGFQIIGDHQATKSGTNNTHGEWITPTTTTTTIGCMVYGILLLLLLFQHYRTALHCQTASNNSMAHRFVRSPAKKHWLTPQSNPSKTKGPTLVPLGWLAVVCRLAPSIRGVSLMAFGVPNIYLFPFNLLVFHSSYRSHSLVLICFPKNRNK